MYVHGTCRLLSPAETITEFGAKAKPAGITRLADVTGLDKIGVPVISAYRPLSHSVSVSMGKGVDLHSAYASAMMEGIELYQAEQIPQSKILECSAEDLSHRGIEFQIEGLLLSGVDHTYIYQTRYKWIEGKELFTNRDIFVPYDAVHTRYHANSIGDHTAFQSSTNGLASGNSTDEATVHAICEVIERDAICLWMQSPETLKHASCVDPRSIDSEICVALLKKLSDAGILVRILDLTTDLNIPVFMVILIDPDLSTSNPARVVYGSGCHLQRDIALSRAITEAAQVRLTIIIGSRDDIPSSVYSSTNSSMAGAYRHLVAAPDITYRTIPDTTLSSIDEELSFLVNLIIGNASDFEQLDKIIRVNIETQELGVPTVKIIIPYLENPHDEHRYASGVRLELAREKWASMGS